MNVVDLANGMIGCFGIVGGSIAAATGAALSAKRTGNVAVAFFGDGAVNQAYFHECLNFAAVEALPACSCARTTGTASSRRCRRSPAAWTSRAAPPRTGIPGAAIDGNDLWAVIEAARAAVERARGGGGPTLLEMQTYRHYGHSKSDPATYRPKGELESWLERDPLKLTRARAGQRGGDRGGRGGGPRGLKAGGRAAAPYPARRRGGEFAAHRDARSDRRRRAAAGVRP